jgi:hypothetical protein
MTNQYAGLSQLLAEQRITERRQRAAQGWLGHGSRPPGRRWSPQPRWCRTTTARQPRPATLPASSTAPTTQISKDRR